MPEGEHYEPTPKKIADAEQMMTNAKRQASEEREKVSEAKKSNIEIETESAPEQEIPEPKEIYCSALRIKGMSRHESDPKVICDRADQTIDLIREQLQNSQGIDLIITPEYGFFFNPDGFSPLRFKQNEQGQYAIERGAPEVVLRLKQIQELAKEHKSNICIGTICEEDTIEGTTVLFNSAVVIDSDGEIIQIRRKTTGSDALGSPGNSKITLARGKKGLEALKTTPLTTEEDQISLEAYEKAAATAKPIEIKTKSGEVLKILIIICAESEENDDLFRFNHGAEVDLVIQVSAEGDDFLTAAFEHQQTGKTDITGRELLWEGGTQETDTDMESQTRYIRRLAGDTRERPTWKINSLREKLLANQIAKPGGIIIALDCCGRQAGYFPIGERGKVKNYEIQEKHVNGLLSVG